MIGRAWILARRELKDQLRDWRITTPIVLLTLFFPVLMNFTASRAAAFVNEYGAEIIATRLLPFLLMVVGFFPISISLVIGLESFAGERERRTLEPLLATPFTDAELYLGKMIASLFLPLAAAFVGIIVYMTALIVLQDWDPPLILVIQMFLITAAQAIVMVSGAVVVSMQVTSVRAANLLASFIIVPMSQLVIVESLVMFWARYDVLWWIILGLLVMGFLLGRSGLHLFNREILLGKELDSLNLRWIASTFCRHFTRGRTTLPAWYKGVISNTLCKLKVPSLMTILVLAGGLITGIYYADRFPLPGELLSFTNLEQDLIGTLAAAGLVGGRGWLWVLWNNLRAVLLAAAAGFLSFGVAGMLLLMAPMGILGYFSANVVAAGQGWMPFLIGLVLPHAVLEVPAMILAGAALLRFAGASISPTGGRTIGEVWIEEFAEWARVFTGVILPLIILAAALEIFLTPRIALLVY